jgi:excisionase family DNA binding protein
MHPMTQERELTTQEVAERLRISWLSVIRRIQAGKLRARKEGNEWRIKESDLEAYIKSTYPDDKE